MDTKQLAQNIVFHVIAQGVRDGRLDKVEWFSPYVDHLVASGSDTGSLLTYDDLYRR